MKENNRFAQWLKEQGFTKLSLQLGVHRTTVHNWAAYRNLPETKYAQQLVKLSKENPPKDAQGPLTFNDIYDGKPLPVLPAEVTCEARA